MYIDPQILLTADSGMGVGGGGCCTCRCTAEIYTLINTHDRNPPALNITVPEWPGKRWSSLMRGLSEERGSWFVFIFILWSWSKLDLKWWFLGWVVSSVVLLPQYFDSNMAWYQWQWYSTVNLTKKYWLVVHEVPDRSHELVRCFWKGNCSESEGDMLKPFFFFSCCQSIKLGI